MAGVLSTRRQAAATAGPHRDWRGWGNGAPCDDSEEDCAGAVDRLTIWQFHQPTWPLWSGAVFGALQSSSLSSEQTTPLKPRRRDFDRWH